MAKRIYQLGIQLMQLFLSIHQYFNQKSALAVAGRKRLFPELEKAMKRNKKPVIWFHAASLGEFEQGRPLMEYFNSNHPSYFILLTFFSPSGYEVRKNYAHANHVCYMPLDTKAMAHKFVTLSRPKMAFFIKYEFWHFHLSALEAAGCWIFSVSSIFRANQAFFKWYGGFNRNMLKQVDHFFVQNATSAALLKGITLNNISVTGDTRFDRVATIVRQAKTIKEIEAFIEGHQVLIGGSTWEPDIETIAPFLQQNTHWKTIIAPHDISEASLKMHEKKLGLKTQRFSEFKNNPLPETQAIIIDNIGMLTSLYQYGSLAFIGGAFGAGLHNTLEAACFGLPIYFGNQKYEKFQEAKDLLENDAAIAVANAQEFTQDLSHKISQGALQKMGENSKLYIQENVGATEKIMNHINPILKKIANER